ncbi:hypothetical protein [Chryseobacterium sp.]|uniref:hypothetical protein n=1 Tax=Chryseobacterium sp. TaxID=1871047 RepID=UPI00289D31A5|nr:hypothetical protein [Chryseobacterium sp.]
MKNSLLKIIFFLLLLPSALKSQGNLTVAGSNWLVQPPTLGDAGSNYAQVYESASNQIQLIATVGFLFGSARISARYEGNPTWNPALGLGIRRTGGSSTVQGGTNYMDLTLTDTSFCTIQTFLSLGSYSIPVQARLNGISVTVPAGNYSSRVVFTISAL